MRRILSVVIVLLLIVPSTFASCKGTQLRAVLQCYEAWLGAYGMVLPTPTTLPQYGDFHAVRMSWFTGQGKANQQKVCDLGNSLITCLQPHWDCIDNEMFERMGQNKLFAYTYHSDLYVTQFQCSDRGLRDVMSSFECVDDVRLNGGAEKQAVCADSIDRYIEETGSRCGGYNAFLSCMHQVYFSRCGSEGADFICGTNRAALLAQVPWCGTSPASEVLRCPGIGLAPTSSSSSFGGRGLMILPLTFTLYAI